jgi:tetratricopeptide (TPR) repeat protein
LIYKKQGHYSQAEPLYKRALAIWEKTFGTSHPRVATSLSNLAGLYMSQGHYAQAEPLFKRSLAIFEKIFGTDHPNVATILENLAGVYRKANRTSEAQELKDRAAKIRNIKRSGLTHTGVLKLTDRR